MKVLFKKQIEDLEASCLKENNIQVYDLIGQVADRIVSQFIKNHKDINSSILVLCGNGKNGADGLKVANILNRLGYNVTVGIIQISQKVDQIFERCKVEIYSSIPVFSIDLADPHSFSIPHYDILLDAILGNGLNRDISIELKTLFQLINNSKGYKIAIDMPSGIFADGGIAGEAIICNETYGVGVAKPSYFITEKSDYIGHLTILNLPVFEELLYKFKTDRYYIDLNYIKTIIKPLHRIAHKYERGSSLIIGGSYGMAGCIKLSGEAALRSGCGLVSLHVPYSAVDFLQASFPEALINVDDNKYHIGPFELSGRYDSIGIGPGMGIKVKQSELLIALFDQVEDIPMVLDADALTLLSQIDNWQAILPRNGILTPHKGEFERLFGKFEDQRQRIEVMKRFSVTTGNIIVLKGADTIISGPEGDIYFVNNGDCGMATAGTGDVLTGLITGLLAQGYNKKEASILGCYLHGMAGSIAAEKLGSRSVIASDILQNISSAYKILTDRL